MYRLEDMEMIDKNLDKIKDDSAHAYKSKYEPTLNEMTKVVKVIKDYLVKNKKIAYGGFAQNLLLKKKNNNEGFYKEIDGVFFNWPDVADIEFYSHEPMADVIKLTEELFKAGFKYIEGSEGIHPETYKLFINFINYCDVSYMPLNIYNNAPIIEIDGIRCIHPHFMMVDAYRILTDPMTSYWRLEKPIKRFQKILKYYPMDESLVDKKILIGAEIKSNNDILKFLRKKIIQKYKFITVGLYAYNYYVKKIKNNNYSTIIPYYEIISIKLNKDANKIYKILNDKFKNKITTKEYYPFFSYLDSRIEFYYEGKLILKMYGSNERCIVYKYSEKKKTYFGTYNLVYMYLLFNYFLAYVNRNKEDTQLYTSLLSKIAFVRNKYLTENNITVVDISPFQDFTYKCIGVPIDPIRQSRLIYADNKSKGRIKKFRYVPTGKMGKFPNFRFKNCSGNQNLQNNLIIKK